MSAGGPIDTRVLNGLVVCNACRHEWRADGDLREDLTRLECPKCTTHQGFMLDACRHEFSCTDSREMRDAPAIRHRRYLCQVCGVRKGTIELDLGDTPPSKWRGAPSLIDSDLSNDHIRLEIPKDAILEALDRLKGFMS